MSPVDDSSEPEFVGGHSVGDSVHRFIIGDDQRPSTALARALSDVKGTTPEEMEPLYNHVNLDALDGLLDPELMHAPQTNCSVTISLQSYNIDIDNETIVIRHLDVDKPSNAVSES